MALVGFVLRQRANQAEKARRVAASRLSDAIAANPVKCAMRTRSLVGVDKVDIRRCMWLRWLALYEVGVQPGQGLQHLEIGRASCRERV